MDPQTAKLFSAAIAILPLFAVAFSLGWLFTSIINAIGRNPSVADTVKGVSLLYFALIEAIALFALLIALLMLFVA
ncbi:MAG: F0F1 ATP synthase subunit C [Alphaproteobacteria bacterium]|nr:F0F1 ATP synthase subunit C [Alphaproteobacteria bacterium]MCK5659599.1 F0F1 ATP synthase subunit C [Alphaproteobacteria bacterium]